LSHTKKQKTHHSSFCFFYDTNIAPPQFKMSDNNVLNIMWSIEDFKDQILNSLITVGGVKFRILTVLVTASSLLEEWRRCVNKKQTLNLSPRHLSNALKLDLAQWKVVMHLNTVIVACARDSKVPFFFGLLLTDTVVVKKSKAGGPLAFEAMTKLQRFLACADWTGLRSCLKMLHSHAKRDSTRGNYRFNFGFTEMEVPASRNFVGRPADPVDGMVYPRVAQIQLDGGAACDIVLDHLVRLVGLIREVLKPESVPASPGLTKVYPLRFPFQVANLDTHQRLHLGMGLYSSGCEVMHRMSVCMFEKSGARVFSNEWAKLFFGTDLPVSARTTKKFESFENTFVHTDANDLNVLQIVAVISHQIPNECFATINLVLNDCVMLHDDEISQDVKLIVFAGYFKDHAHGRVEVDPDWVAKCHPDAWMIRVTPYTTVHCSKWCKKLIKQGMSHTLHMIRSFYMVPGSQILGMKSTPDDVRSLLVD
jgi:hypothetical protein